MARPGVAITVLGADGTRLESRRARTMDDSTVRGFGADADRVRIETTLLLAEPGEHRVEVAPVGAHRVVIDGQLVSVSTLRVGAEVVLNSSHNHPLGHSVLITVTEPRRIAIEAELQVVDAEGFGRFAKAELRHSIPGPSIEDEIVEAVAAAAAADVAIVVVGTTSEVESEGWDRPDLALPGRQNELVRRVLAANPRTVVVVNAGAPVELPWLDEVPATLWWWLPVKRRAASWPTCSPASPSRPADCRSRCPRVTSTRPSRSEVRKTAESPTARACWSGTAAGMPPVAPRPASSDSDSATPTTATMPSNSSSMRMAASPHG